MFEHIVRANDAFYVRRWGLLGFSWWDVDGFWWGFSSYIRKYATGFPSATEAQEAFNKYQFMRRARFCRWL